MKPAAVVVIGIGLLYLLWSGKFTRTWKAITS